MTITIKTHEMVLGGFISAVLLLAIWQLGLPKKPPVPSNCTKR